MDDCTKFLFPSHLPKLICSGVQLLVSLLSPGDLRALLLEASTCRVETKNSHLRAGDVGRMNMYSLKGRAVSVLRFSLPTGGREGKAVL